MTENMKKFLELVSKDKALCENVCTAQKDTLFVIAKEIGFELKEEDLAAPCGELGDDEFDAVVGGGGGYGYNT